MYKNGKIIDFCNVKPKWCFIVDENNSINLNVIKYESMEKGLKNLAKYDSRYNIFNKIYNKIYYKPKKVILTDLQLKLINQIYKKDFELFGYKKYVNSKKIILKL